MGSQLLFFCVLFSTALARNYVSLKRSSPECEQALENTQRICNSDSTCELMGCAIRELKKGCSDSEVQADIGASYEEMQEAHDFFCLDRPKRGDTHGYVDSINKVRRQIDY